MSPPDNAYPWRPAPLAWLAMASLAAAAAAVALRPGWWPWALAAVAANFLLLTVAVFIPRGQLLGLNLTRLPASSARRNLISLTFDDGPDPAITPQVLDLLDRHNAKASFFCVGDKAAAHPEIVREIVRRGHSVENHSLRHLGRVRALWNPPPQARRRVRAGDPARHRRARAALLPRAGGIAQRVARSGAGALRPALCFLDPARPRRHGPRSGPGAAAADRDRSRRATSCCCTTAGRWCSRCCRSCWKGSSARA